MDFRLFAWKLTKFIMPFSKPQVRFPLILHCLSVSWHIIALKFSSWNIIYFGQKEPIKVQFYRLFSTLMKVHPISHVIFEITGSRFIPILYHCSVSWKITPLYFFGSNLVHFGQKEPIKVKFSEFWVVGWPNYSPNSSCHIWNQKSVFLKLCITLQCHER